MQLQRTLNSLWYDRLAERFRVDPTAVVRIDPEGRTPMNVRQAMRQRGLYVTVSAKAQDRPFMTIFLTETPGAIDLQEQPETLAPPPEMLQALATPRAPDPEDTGMRDLITRYTKGGG